MLVYILQRVVEGRVDAPSADRVGQGYGSRSSRSFVVTGSNRGGQLTPMMARTRSESPVKRTGPPGWVWCRVELGVRY